MTHQSLISKSMWQSGTGGREVVENTISNVESSLGFKSHGMLLRMALIESDFGTHRDTYNTSFRDHTGLHSIGIWQITKVCLEETQNNREFEEERDRIKHIYKIDWTEVKMHNMQKPLHNCLAAVLYMKLAEKGCPTDLQGQATKWKNDFNRNPHGLPIDGFIKKCRDHDMG